MQQCVNRALWRLMLSPGTEAQMGYVRFQYYSVLVSGTSRPGSHGRRREVVRWYSAYLEYFFTVRLSVNDVLPWKRHTNNAAPTHHHLGSQQAQPAAAAPNPQKQTQIHCSKKKFGWRENRKRPPVKKPRVKSPPKPASSPAPAGFLEAR